MAITSFWGRETSNTANADTLVVGNEATVTLTISRDDPNIPGVDTSGDTTLEGGGTATSYGTTDPDTWIIVNGVTYRVVFDAVGTLPVDNKVPDPLEGEEVFVVRLYSLTDPPVLFKSYFFVWQDSSTPGLQALMNSFGNGNIRLNGENLNPPPECFAAGAEIMTPSGQRKVESLRVGDCVLTEDGRSVQIAWVGHSRHDEGAATFQTSIRPVEIHANAFGPGLPAKALTVSPQHRVMVEGPECELLFGQPRVLVVARHLPKSLAHSPVPEGAVEYFHILLEQHEVLVSNGLPTESFQPARRKIEAMTAEARASLDATLAVLGESEMLSRPDAYPTLSSPEAKVLGNRLAKAARAAGVVAIGKAASVRLDA